jgi:hypothetical protein
MEKQPLSAKNGNTILMSAEKQQTTHTSGNARSGILRHAACVLLFALLPFVVGAQYYTSGEDPAWVKWRQIQSRRFTLIYPSSLDATAQRYAWLFDRIADSVYAPLGVRPARMPVVLHAYNVSSNGLVSWAPSRMELLTTPPTDAYAQAWDKQLALHETRHAAQMTKLGGGAVKILHFFTGEQAEGLAAGIIIPGWYLEGDAVVSETALSGAGRGRSPNFLMPQKAYLENDVHFTQDMWKNGSYRYLMPGNYVYGYIISTYAYLKGGTQTFDRTLDYTVKHPYAIPPFDRGLRKYTGRNEEELQKESFAELKKMYRRDDSLRGNDVPHRPLTPRNRDYCAFRYPVMTGDRRTVAVKNTLHSAAQLVEIDSSGHVHTLRAIGDVNSSLHLSRGVVYWTETVPHRRWAQQSYSVIKAYDLRRRKLYTLTHGTRFFGVSINAGGTQLATVENTPEGESRIVVIPYIYSDARKPPELLPETARHIPAPRHQVWNHVVWYPANDTLLVATLLTDNGCGLYEVNLISKKYTALIEDNFQDIKRPAASGDFIAFESGYDGANNIYAVKTNGDTQTTPVYKLTNARYGAFDAAFNAAGDSMTYVNYHTYGYEPVRIATDSLLWQANDFNQPYRFAWADSLSKTAHINIDTLTPPSAIRYPSKPYHKAGHLFRIHSWLPFYFNPDVISQLALDRFANAITPGAILFSQNTLGTAIGWVGYKYEYGFHSGHLGFTYKGWVPVIEYSMDVNDRYAMQRNVLNNRVASRDMPSLSSTVRLYIPFNFSSNGWQRQLIPQIDGHFTNDIFDTNTSSYPNGYLLGVVTWFHRRNMAMRELYPRWGYMLRMWYLRPLADAVFSDMKALQLTTYLPGIAPNHSLQLKAGYQTQNNSIHPSGQALPQTRGYTHLIYPDEITLNADYSFPLFYPDWNISYVAFFKRVQMNLFTDYAILSAGATKQTIHTAGFDFLIDMHLFRFAFPIAAGFRCAVPLPAGISPSFNLLFNIRFH